jgi:hypothetical protein
VATASFPVLLPENVISALSELMLAEKPPEAVLPELVDPTPLKSAPATVLVLLLIVANDTPA